MSTQNSQLAGAVTPGVHGNARNGLQASGLLVFVAAFGLYLLLDWVTFTPAFAPTGIPPWNPPIGLVLAIVFANGFKFLPLLIVAPLVDDMFVRDLPFPWHVSALEALVTGLGYGMALWHLRNRHAKVADDQFSLRNFSYLLAVLSLAALVVALAHGAILFASGLAADQALGFGILRYWIGELIGIAVVFPFTLIMQRTNRLPDLTWEMVVHACMIVAAIAIVFGLAGQTRLHFSYLLFLPIVLIAVRFGMPGAATGLIVTQVGIMIALHVSGDQPSHVPAFQALMASLAITGLVIGSLIDERRRVDLHLRRQQEALARSARIGTLGEVTTAIAHELNQPLTAARNYHQLMQQSLEDQPPDIGAAREAGADAMQQLQRSIEIIRRLREFIRVGRLEIGAHDFGELFEESRALLRPEFERLDTSPDLRLEPGLPRVAVDPLQIEQVLINLLRNSLEAIKSTDRMPVIVVTAARLGRAFVEVTVSDNGCGFPPGFDVRQGAGTQSTKSDGLGVGLALCLSIIENHGGTLGVTSSTKEGATVTMTLPIAGSSRHG